MPLRVLEHIGQQMPTSLERLAAFMTELRVELGRLLPRIQHRRLARHTESEHRLAPESLRWAQANLEDLTGFCTASKNQGKEQEE